MALMVNRRVLLISTLLMIALLTISAFVLRISVHEDWHYVVAHSGIKSVSGIAIDDDILYATLETRHYDGQLIAIKDGVRTILESSLQKPDGLTLCRGNPTYTQERIGTYVYVYRQHQSQPIFETNGAEGIDCLRNGDLFVVEDRPGGRLLKYSNESGTVTELAHALDQAEGVCAMESGVVFYAEKRSDTVYKVENGVATPFVTGLIKPAFLYCDEDHRGLWITEDRRNFGRLLYSNSAGSLSVIASGLNSPQSLDFDAQGNLFLAEQGKDRILKFTHKPGVASLWFAHKQ